ncbi:hypothetical protein PR048_032502 [Dryococelus australis]|uniref:Uncharacterized protein n=1 Tax=Dryococelus australis TaxID=614101 RepID=A0ABQ9G6J7_9NEOP|nr:hypothetical protein PR048_032502 [Dryococelus australis]
MDLYHDTPIRYPLPNVTPSANISVLKGCFFRPSSHLAVETMLKRCTLIRGTLMGQLHISDDLYRHILPDVRLRHCMVVFQQDSSRPHRARVLECLRQAELHPDSMQAYHKLAFHLIFACFSSLRRACINPFRPSVHNCEHLHVQARHDKQACFKLALTVWAVSSWPARLHRYTYTSAVAVPPLVARVVSAFDRATQDSSALALNVRDSCSNDSHKHEHVSANQKMYLRVTVLFRDQATEYLSTEEKQLLIPHKPAEMASPADKHVGIPFANQCLVTYSPDGSPANREYFAAENGYGHLDSSTYLFCGQPDEWKTKTKVTEKRRATRENPDSILKNLFIKELEVRYVNFPMFPKTSHWFCNAHSGTRRWLIIRGRAGVVFPLAVACNGCQASPFLTELRVIGAHNREVLNAWLAITYDVTDTVVEINCLKIFAHTPTAPCARAVPAQAMGATVAERSDYSRPTKANRVTPGSSHVGIVPDDAAGRRVFSGISRFPRPFIPALLHTHLKHLHRLSRPPGSEPLKSLHPFKFLPPLQSNAAPYSPHFTLIGSQNLAVKSRPNLSTPFPSHVFIEVEPPDHGSGRQPWSGHISTANTAWPVSVEFPRRRNRGAQQCRVVVATRASSSPTSAVMVSRRKCTRRCAPPAKSLGSMSKVAAAAAPGLGGGSLKGAELRDYLDGVTQVLQVLEQKSACLKSHVVYMKMLYVELTPPGDSTSSIAMSQSRIRGFILGQAGIPKTCVETCEIRVIIWGHVELETRVPLFNTFVIGSYFVWHTLGDSALIKEHFTIVYPNHPLVRTVLDTTWRTLAQWSPSTVTADNQCAFHISIFVHMTVESILQGIELANFTD